MWLHTVNKNALQSIIDQRSEESVNKTKGIILVIIVVALAGFIGFRLGTSHKSTTPSDNTVTTEEHSTEPKTPEAVTLTNKEWTNIVLTALDCADEDGTVTVDENNDMTVSGKLSKSTVEKWLEEGNVELNSMYRTALNMLPDSMPMTLTCSVSCSNGEVTLKGKSLQASSIDLPTDLISDSVWDGINQTLNDELAKKADSISDIQFQKDSVVLEP